MSDSFLPPVVAVLGADIAAYTAGLASAEAKMVAFVEAQTVAIAELDAKMATLGRGGGASGAGMTEMSAGMAEVGAESERMATQVGASMTKVQEELVRTAEATRPVNAAAMKMATEWEFECARMQATTAKLSAGMALEEAKVAQGWERYDAGTRKAAASAEASAGSFGVSKQALQGVGLAAGFVAVESIKMAGNYETATNRLLTSGGELHSNIEMVRQGMLAMSTDVGVSAEELAKHMYTIQSAGYHGAEGLGVLKAAEQGAKAEQADAIHVTDALTSAMRDYYPAVHGAADVSRVATDVMSKFIGATSAGKLTFDQLAASLHSVLPVASRAGISLQDILGAEAAMTVHGYSADQATQNLAHAIGHLQTVTAPQAKELWALGINAQDLSQKLGERGLTGSMQMIAQAIQKHMGPESTKVVIDLVQSLKQLPPALQKLGQEAIAGTISAKDFTKAAKDMGVVDSGVVSGFATLLKATHGLGKAQTDGAHIIQTYSEALKAATGDQTGMNVALMLTGENADYTNSAVKQVGASVADAAGNVKGWADVSETYNQKASQAKAAMSTLAIEIGNVFLPAATKVMGVLSATIGWFAKHSAAATTLAFVIGTVLVLAFVSLASKGLLALANLALGFAATTLEAAASVIEAGIVAGAWIAANIAIIIATGGIILIIGALIAIGYYLITHWNDVKRIAGEVWHAISTAVSNAIQAIIGFIKNLIAQYANAKTWLYNAGLDIVTGLWNGIKAGWTWLTSNVSALASNLLTAAKNALGIKSPSRVFADEVGAWIGPGIAEGIDQTGHHAVTAAELLASQVASTTANAHAPVRGGYGAPNDIAVAVGSTNPNNRAGGGGGGRHHVHIHCNVSGSVWTTRLLMEEIRTEVQRYGLHNANNGLDYSFS